MNAQEIFETVVRHLSKQGRRSMRALHGAERPEWIEGGAPAMRCAYRGDGGTMCAVGVLIPDEEYRPTLEGLLVRSLLDRADIGTAVAALRRHASLLFELQRAHDSVMPNNGPIAIRLARIACAYELDGRQVAELPWPEVWA